MRIFLDVAEGNIPDGAFTNVPAFILMGVLAIGGLMIVAGIVVAIVFIVKASKKKKLENGND